MQAGDGWRERERKTIPSRLRIVRAQPDSGLEFAELWDHDLFNRLSPPGAPRKYSSETLDSQALLQTFPNLPKVCCFLPIGSLS